MKKYSLLILCILCTQFAFSQATLLHENFTNCITSFPSGWQKYSVTGSDSWQCTSAGQTGKGTQMSGYSSGSNHDNEDWLISPLLNFSLYSNPMLSFWCRTKYSGWFIQVLVSNNYSGSGNPNNATWTVLPAVLPTSSSDVWFLSDNISLQSFKNTPLHIAYKYTSNTSAAATWKIDEVNVTDGTLTVSKKFMNIGETSQGVPSISSSFQFTMSSILSNFIIDAPSPFEVSKDGSSYSNQLIYPSSISGVSQTVYVRMNPSAGDKLFRNEISFKQNGNTLAEKILVLGTSLPDNKTLRVFSWNMRWFGDPSSCNCDTNLARSNATQILKDIDADVYCLQEVVNNNQIALIAGAMGPNYQYVVSPFCSFASNPSDPSYSSGQKLAYIYNTHKIENIHTFGLLASTYPSDTSSNSGYYCFASGRFPFIMKAKLRLEAGNFDTIIFSNIHGKANSDVTSYNRRQCGATKMTDSLNALFPNNKIIVIGDYNDYLEGTQVSSLSVTPYKHLFDNGFIGITLPSKYPYQTTFVTSPNHILDNISISQNMNSVYPDSTCFIFDEVEKYIPDYVNSTSDHFPVMSYFKFNFFPLNTNEITQSTHPTLFNIANPSSGVLTLFINEAMKDPFYLTVYDIIGNKVFSKKVESFSKHMSFDLNFLNQGFYFVELNTGKNHEIRKWQRLNEY